MEKNILKLGPLLLSGISLFFGSISLLDKIGVTVYLVQDRSTTTTSFELGMEYTYFLLVVFTLKTIHNYVENKKIASFTGVIIIFLYFAIGEPIILPAACVISAIIDVVKIQYHERRINVRTDPLYSALIIQTTLAFIALTHWAILFPLGVTEPLKNIAELMNKVSSLSVYFSPYLIFLVFLIWLIKPLRKHLEYDKKPKNDEERLFTWEPKCFFFGLTLLSIIFSTFSYLYLYNRVVNPRLELVGVDIDDYVFNLTKINAGEQSIWTPQEGSRPLLYWTLIMFQKLLGISEYRTVQAFPLFLNPLFVVSMIFLSNELYQDDQISAWTGFFASTGYYITVGTYGYFLANNLALILLTLSLAVLFRSIRESNILLSILAGTLSSLTMFIHPYSLLQYLAGFLFLIVSLYINKKDNYGVLKTIIPFVAVIFIFEVLKNLLFGQLGFFNSTLVLVEGPRISLEIYRDLLEVFIVLYGGYMSNLIIIILSIVGIYYMDHTKTSFKYLKWFLLISFFVFIVMDAELKSRIIYNIPFPLFCSHGYVYIRSRVKHASIITLSIMINLSLYLFNSITNII